jgi:hypothetical protein
MKILTAFAAMVVLLGPTVTSAQLLRGGPIGGRLERFKEQMTNKDESIRYDPSVLAPGVARSDVVAGLGEPNASQSEGVSREDVWAFFPDGSKFKDPEITGATIAAAVFNRRDVARGAQGAHHRDRAPTHALPRPLRQ